MTAATLARQAKQPFLGLGLNTFSREALLELLETALRSGERFRISFLNPYYAVRSLDSARLREQMNWFDALQADGWGIVLAARWCGIPAPERLAIEDFENEFFSAVQRNGRRVFLFGSAPGIAERAAETLRATFPGLEIVGTLHGWLDVEGGHPGHFSAEDHQRSVDVINASGADAVLVGLPTPLQQEWVVDNDDRIAAPLVMTVGAYFDKLAESMDWYPDWMDRLRLGWLYRVYREPRRMAKRYASLAWQYSRAVVRFRATGSVESHDA